VLAGEALSDLPFLKSLTFESGSKLREIQGLAFAHCGRLKSICLPSSVSAISGSAFRLSSIESITVDGANPNYFVSGQFLIAIDGMELIRYFDHGGDLAVDCLCGLGLRQMVPELFSGCQRLKSVLIPASIEILGNCCFSNCTLLTEIIFEPGSKLNEMAVMLFIKCYSLQSICIPANVETIHGYCFANCTSLANVSFAPGSKLTRIEEDAFIFCCSLRSLVIPATLEIMMFGIFHGCTSLCELIFDVPSRLKQLDLPPSEFGCLCIPDCVTIVCGAIGKQEGQHRLLRFGRESCVMTIELRDPNSYPDAASNSFVDVSEDVLRRFRCGFEAL
jgi:hypothetical protein